MTRVERSSLLEEVVRHRILVLDGAMGTMIQNHELTEADFRGSRFKNWEVDLRGNNDLVSLSRPELIGRVHEGYFRAGADIGKTNTFNANAISQADYGMEELVVELNVAAVTIARQAADRIEAEDGRPRFVAGAIGPTNRTASMSPDVNNPAFRHVTFDMLRDVYDQQARALVEAGVDILLIETIFDTLNAKAALFAIEDVFDTLGYRVPLMVSATITDLSGRLLAGQTVEAFWNSIRHAQPFSVGLNCALGAKELRPYVAELSRVADCQISTHPNAGLPNEFGGYDETPESMATLIGEFAAAGLVNIVGGCCGSTPDHIRAIAAAVEGVRPRKAPRVEAILRLAGLEPFSVN